MIYHKIHICNLCGQRQRQKIDNVTQLQIIDDKKHITGKKSIITACNVDYRLKRSGPLLERVSSTKAIGFNHL